MKKYAGLAVIDDLELLHKVKKDLTLPNPEYLSKATYTPYSVGDTPKVITYYKDIEDYVMVPRNYPKAVKKYEIEAPILNKLKFKGSLREYQSEYLSGSLPNDSILEVPCGHGKTVMAAWLISIRLQRTLVLVPTNTLLDQWVLRLNQFLLNVKVAAPTSKKECESLEDYDVVIMTYDLYNSKYRKRKIYNSIGQLIIDEAHRIGAQVYSPIINEIPSKYRIALSATFRRKDNAHKILDYHFGKRFKMSNQYPQPKLIQWDFDSYTGNVVKVTKETKPIIIKFLIDRGIEYKSAGDMLEIDPENPPSEHYKDYILEQSIAKKDSKVLASFCSKANKGNSFSTIDSYIAEEPRRIKWAITILNKCLSQGRCVLLISKRKSILEKLHKIFSAKCKSRLVVSKHNKNTSNFEDLSSADIIFGVSQLANEGLDVDRLDTLIMFHPISDPEQAFGRIRRYNPNKKSPTVIWPKGEFKGYDALLKKSKEYIEVTKTITVTNFMDFNNELNKD
jgi:superfamily II DNA or RNA helicase